LTLLTGCGHSPTPTTTPDRAIVVEVVDGDTVRLQLGDTREDVRLIGIDTPETKHPTKPVECFGPEASAFLTRLLPVGTALRVERDIEGRDSYRRLLLYLFLPTSDGERFVNLELVARGFATPLSIEPNTRYQQHFVAAAFDAQQHSRGLWDACK
jgi:micrococcal nuclease